MGQDRRVRTEIYLTLFLLAAAIVVQGTLLSRVRLFGAHPNLVLVMVVCWSLLRSVREGLLWAFIGGLGTDLVAGLPLGTSPLGLMPICFLAGIGRSSMYAQNVFWPVLLVALATPVHGWIVLLTQEARGLPVDWLASTLRVILPELVLNILLAIPAYPAFRWLVGRLGLPVMEW